jgi:hypothetical protein
MQQKEGTQDLEAERLSFELACDALDLILECKRMPRADIPSVCADLRITKSKHMDAHLAAYGSQYLIPKHHQSLAHVADQLEEDGFALDMFVIERLNLRVKHVAEPVHNLLRFENSVLSSLLTRHHNELQTAFLKEGLQGKIRPMQDRPGVRVANSAAFQSFSASALDVVIRGDFVGRVHSCADADDGQGVFLLLQELVPCEPRWRTSGTYNLNKTTKSKTKNIKQKRNKNKNTKQTNPWYVQLD